jgi:hypothetical protein
VYRLSGIIDINTSVLLRGAGKDATTLYFNCSLTDLKGNTYSEGGAGSGVSDYSHGTGLINFWGWDPIKADRTFMTRVAAPAMRGATVLQVSALVVGAPGWAMQ